MRWGLVALALAAGALAGLAGPGRAQAQALPPGCIQQSYESRQTAIDRCDGEDSQRAAQLREDARANAQREREMTALLADLRARPPLPASQNRLLGRWQAPRQAQGTGEMLGEILSGQAGALLCGSMFGGGQVEFGPERWALTDSAGRDDMGPVSYRAERNGAVAVLPAQGTRLMVFEFAGADRMRLAGQGPECDMTRIGPASASRTAAPVTGAQPARQAAQAASADQRPADEICARSFLTELGKARAAEVRPILKAKFRENAEGTAPGAATLRLTGRRSLCEDPRIMRTDYDFDGGGVLRKVTQVWPQAAAGEVKALMTRYATSPPRSVGGRLEGANELYNFAIEERPQEQAVSLSFTALTP